MLENFKKALYREDHLKRDRDDISLLFRHFLIHSWLYYICDESILPDDEFDYICQLLHNNAELVHEVVKELHPKFYRRYKKHLNSFSDGSGGFIAKKDYPIITRCAAGGLLEKFNKAKEEKGNNI